jgi:hypothetical protein
MATPTPVSVDIPSSIAALSTLGVLPVIAIVAVLGLAAWLYRRFRR